MTKALDQVMTRAAALPEDEQNALANRWLAELEDEDLWAKKFSGSEDILSRLAEEALDEHRKGLTEDLDPERL